MTTTDTDLDLRIRTFKSSSSFTPGDAWSFSIHLSNDVELPGKYNPIKYINRLNIDVVGKNILVVCPGNAGLCVAALREGASTVVALEPRSLYHRSLPAVSEFTSEVVGTTFSQRLEDENLIESFDTIIWSEGLDDIPHPKGLIEKVIGSMKTGATLYFEVNHGHQGALPESVNSWLPTKEAFEESINDLGDLEFIGRMSGRSQTRTIHMIKNNAAPTKPTKAAVKVVKKVDEKIAEERVATPAVDVKIPDNVSEVARKLVDKVKKIIPVHEEGELDSLYEGRPSTPKSKEKKKTRARKRKGSGETKPKS